jgi:hypothetical protein
MLHVSSNAASVTKNGRNKRKLGVFTKAQKSKPRAGRARFNEAVNYIEATSNPTVPFFCDIQHETGPRREIASLSRNVLGNDPKPFATRALTRRPVWVITATLP